MSKSNALSSSSCQFHQSHQQPSTRMIEFIDSLYSKYKILNLLSQQQSNNFQTQIITMLIDQNQCLDLQLYQQTVLKIGLSTFLLQILAIVMQKRNKYRNQYQMNKNIQVITKQLDKQRIQLTRRRKQLDRKQLQLNQQRSSLITLLQEKAKQVQQKTLTKLFQTEQQIKKRIKQLMNTLKSKQKQLVDKNAGLKESLKKVKQLQIQQIKVEQKIKLLEKKQKQRKSKQTTDRQQLLSLQQSTKKQQQLTTTRINTLQQTNSRLQQQISRLNKKIKTNQMASKHYKQDLQKKMTKWSELSERLRVVEGEKGELMREKLLLEEKMLELQRQRDNCDNVMELHMKAQQIDRLTKQFKQSKQTIYTLKKQNQALLSKIKQLSTAATTSFTTTTINNRNSHNSNSILPQFQQLDISKIEQLEILSKIPQIGNNSGGVLRKQLRQQSQQQEDGMIQNEQYSIIHQVAHRIQQQQHHRQSSSHHQLQQYHAPSHSSSILQNSNIQIFDNYFNLNLNSYQQKQQSSVNKTNPNTTNYLPDTILNQINQLLTLASDNTHNNNSQQCQYLSTLSQHTFINWIHTISSQLKYNKTLIQSLLQLFLHILQPCTCTHHATAFNYLFSSTIILFLQQVFLKYQAITPTIQEKSLIVLSRILLSYQNCSQSNKNKLVNGENKFTLTQSYIKSLKVKSLIQRDDFILSNIKFLIDYNV